MRFYTKYCLALLGAIMMTVPVWASGFSMHKDSMPFDIGQMTTIGTTQLMPGHYRLQATESAKTLDVVQDGKIIATVPCSWYRLSSKAENSEIFSNSNTVTGLEFQGRTEAVKIG